MKKTSSQSIMGKYSSNKASKKKTTDSMPLMTTYEQRFKGSMSKEVTEPIKKKTLDEKIEAKKTKQSSDDVQVKAGNKVSVEIAGVRYLLGCTDDASENRIRRVASLANDILESAKATNQGLTNSKVSFLALLDACDQIITLKDENSNYRTELMYRQQQEILNKQNHPVELTPMEKLANEIASEEK